MKLKNNLLTLILKGGALVLALALFVFTLVMPAYRDLKTGSIDDRIAQLQSLSTPKIVLIGDSNVAAGFDSKRIEAAFGMPVVNFGLHAGLGQAFHSNQVKPYIGKGDIVVLIPSSYDENGSKIPDCVIAWVTVENNWQLIRNISPDNIPGMVAAFPKYLRRVLDLWLVNRDGGVADGDEGSRTVINENGDNIFPRPESVLNYEEGFNYFEGDVLDPAMQKYWNDYAAYTQSKGATLYMGCPPVMASHLPENLDEVQRSIEDGLDFPVISRLADYVYTDDLFYDNGLHMTDAGVEIRTTRLIADLQAALPA